MSDQELESLKSAADTNSLHFGLFGIAFGAALSLLITIKTVTFTDVYTYFAFWSGFLVTSFAAVYFAVRALLSRQATKNLVTTIKNESVTRESEYFDEPS